MNKIVNMLIKRDNLSQENAEKAFNDVKDQVDQVIENGGSFDELESILLDELGLEMDYIFDIVDL